MFYGVMFRLLFRLFHLFRLFRHVLGRPPTCTHGVIQSPHISVTRVGTSTAVLICIFEVILHKINIPLEETSSVMTVALKSIIFSVYSIFLHATRAFNEYNNREIENKMAESIFVLKLWTQAFITCCCCCCFLL